MYYCLMKKALLLQSAALLFLLMLSGCGKDPKGTTTTPNQTVSRKFKYKVTVSPALDYGYNGSNGAEYNTASVTCAGVPNSQDPNAIFTPFNNVYYYSGLSEKSPFSSYQDPNEYDVKTGGIITLSFGIMNLKSLGCKQVKVEFYLDGKIYKSVDLPAGIVSYTTTPSPTYVYCPGSANSKGGGTVQITVP